MSFHCLFWGCHLQGALNRIWNVPLKYRLMCHTLCQSATETLFYCCLHSQVLQVSNTSQLQLLSHEQAFQYWNPAFRLTTGITGDIPLKTTMWSHGMQSSVYANTMKVFVYFPNKQTNYYPDIQWTGTMATGQTLTIYILTRPMSLSTDFRSLRNIREKFPWQIQGSD
jgi:hypothetical protein